MNRAIAIFVATVFISPGPLFADYGVKDRGTWPESWPDELERLRKQSRTLEGPLVPLQHFAIPFTDRDAFEEAWPHLLKVKGQGAPIILTGRPSFWLGDDSRAGVCVHSPPKGEAPLDAKKAGGDWRKTVYIELIVDGDIVDLNRIPIPPDTPIIDKRFEGAGTP